MRPRGTHGEIARAMWHAADAPATVRELAQRAQVGYQAARYTASRMVDRGELEVVASGRPALLQRAVLQAADTEGDDPRPMLLHELWWGRPA